ncbi:MAG TPA: site-2 protease family protein [Chitinophagaceae bacterium]|nr:site-2 protease family protein [Chitinophagaceae bacterium]
MDNIPTPVPERDPDERGSMAQGIVFYPPKYEKNETGSNIWIRSILSLALYLVLGYYIFRSFEMLLLITAIVIFHELGHFFAMKFFRYKDLGIFFIPLLGAYVSGSKREVSQRESAIILLAGPIPGIVLGALFYILYKNNPDLSFLGISFYSISVSLIVLNLINLLPVYPLDGGQLLNRVFLDEESWVSKVFVFLSAGFLCWVALFAFQRPVYPLLIFPALMIMRMFSDSRLNSIEKKMEAEGIELDRSYEDLPDADYWRIRDFLADEHPAFKDIVSGPPYTYSSKEDKVMTTIESLLHRHLIQDMSWLGKIFILLVWIAALMSPWLMDINHPLLQRLGF